MNAQRLEAVRRTLRKLRLDALLVSFLPHVRYLTGFSGSNGLIVILPSRAYFVTDGRYTTQAREEVRESRVLIARRGLVEEVKKRRILPPRGRIGFEVQYLTVAELENLKLLFPRARFIPSRKVVEAVCAVKDEEEINAIRGAVAVSEEVFRAVLALLKPGLTELDVAAEIVYLHRTLGADAEAFEPIVASGERGALPHARATAKKIRKGDLVTLDFGCRVRGYHSDMTRTVAVGRPGREARRIYEVVKEGQQRAVDAARSGMTARNLDAVARKYIVREGYGRFFLHSLGHGLGLQVHEAPRISALSTDVLESGNVITIEPGIYVPRLGGVRIEDDVVIREKTCEPLTTATKELVIV